jgi:hypothetical protein
MDEDDTSWELGTALCCMRAVTVARIYGNLPMISQEVKLFDLWSPG